MRVKTYHIGRAGMLFRATSLLWVNNGHHFGALGMSLVPPNSCLSCCSAEVFSRVP